MSFENPFTHSAPPFKIPGDSPLQETESTTFAQTQEAASNTKKHFLDTTPHAPTFGKNPIFEKSIIEHQKFEEKEKSQKEKTDLEHFFQSGDIETITDFLLDEKIQHLSFHKEVARIKNEYASELSTATFLSEKDWRLLTALELYDQATLKHSIGTYLIVRAKVEERMSELGKEVNTEGVQHEQLYRAALLHDIGKMAIPKFLLNSKTTDAEWTYHFCQLDKETQDNILVENKIIVPDKIRNDLGQMTNFFYENRIRAVKIVPIGAVLLPEEKQQMENLQLPMEDMEQGISLCDLPLGKIIQLHEKKSEEILQKCGYFVEALLAGNHHNYKYQDKKLGEKPVSLTLTHLSIETASNIIHLADVQHAMSGDRSYHLKNPALRILAFMVDDAEKGIIEPKVTAKWIFDELKKMSPAYLYETRNLLAKRQHHQYMLERQKELERIDEFLYDNLPESEEYHFDLAA